MATRGTPGDARPGLADPGPEVGIREMNHGDVRAVVAIERASFSVPWTASTFRSLLERSGAGLWVATARDEVVGYAVVWAVLDQAELGNVAVVEAFRRRGLASRLVETVLAWLEERGVRDVYLEVRESNRGARRLYERHGFVAVGRRKGYYSRPREDAFVLRRTVGSEPGGLRD